MSCTDGVKALRLLSVTFDYFTLLRVEPATPDWSQEEGVFDGPSFDEVPFDGDPAEE